jgi:TonB family protein
MSDRLKVTLAVVASLLLHALFLLALVLGALLLRKESPSAPTPELKVVEVTLQAQPTPTPAPETIEAAPAPPAEQATRSVLDTEGLAESEKAPDKPLFESDKNSVAASSLPATGSAPLPSQNGKTRPFEQFTTQQSSVGNGEQPAMKVASAAPPAPPKAPPLPESKVSPTPAPTPNPEPTPEELTLADSSASPPPEDAPLFQPTPVPSPNANAFPVGKPTPIPSPRQSNPKAIPKATPTEVAMLATKPQPRPEQPRPDPGYQEQREQTKIEGSISNRGRAGVDALGTPLGRYRKAIADAIGSRWYYYVNQRMDLITIGDVHIRFVINEQGRVQRVKILSNTANATFGEFCMRSVTEAKIPPLPADIVPTLQNGELAIEYHFTIYPQ